MSDFTIKDFRENGIQFSYHQSWKLAEKCWGKSISSLLFEGDDEESCAIDIYHVSSSSVPTLNQYEKVHFESFINELPFSFKLVDPPTKNSEKRPSFYGEAIGSRCQFCIRSFFVLDTNHVSLTFRLDTPNKVSFVSVQFLKENEENSLRNFDVLLKTYRAD